MKEPEEVCYQGLKWTDTLDNPKGKMETILVQEKPSYDEQGYL